MPPTAAIAEESLQASGRRARRHRHEKEPAPVTETYSG